MRQIFLIERCLADYIEFESDIRFRHAVVRDIVSEILQESLGILIIKKEYIKNETQTVVKRRPAGLLLYLETHVNRMIACYMRTFCAILWNKGLVLAISRI